MKKILIVLILTLFALPAFAQQDVKAVIDNPEDFQMYYGSLDGQADYYNVNFSEEGVFNVTILVPDQENQLTNYDVIMKNNEEKTMLMLEGRFPEWPAKVDDQTGFKYLQGPKGRRGMYPGDFQITVSNKEQSGDYILVIGEGEYQFDKDYIRNYELAEVDRFINNKIIIIAVIIFVAMDIIIFMYIYRKRKSNLEKSLTEPQEPEI